MLATAPCRYVAPYLVIYRLRKYAIYSLQSDIAVCPKPFQRILCSLEENTINVHWKQAAEVFRYCVQQSVIVVEKKNFPNSLLGNLVEKSTDY